MSACCKIRFHACKFANSAARTHSGGRFRPVLPAGHPGGGGRGDRRGGRHQQDDALPALRFQGRTGGRISALPGDAMPARFWDRARGRAPGRSARAIARLAHGDAGACARRRPARLRARQCGDRAAREGSSGAPGDRGVQDRAARPPGRRCAARPASPSPSCSPTSCSCCSKARASARRASVRTAPPRASCAWARR